jgi:hypothetical protein
MKRAIRIGDFLLEEGDSVSAAANEMSFDIIKINESSVTVRMSNNPDLIEIPINLWSDAVVIEIGQTANDPNVMFKRKNS